MSQANLLTSQILTQLHAVGCYAWRAQSTGIPMPNGAWRTAPKKGVSDILSVCPFPNPGTLLAIEVKIGKDRLSPEQEGFLKNVEHVGGRSFVAKDLDTFLAWLKEVK